MGQFFKDDKYLKCPKCYNTVLKKQEEYRYVDVKDKIGEHTYAEELMHIKLICTTCGEVVYKTPYIGDKKIYNSKLKS